MVCLAVQTMRGKPPITLIHKALRLTHLSRPEKNYHKTVTFMQPKVYRAMQRAQGKMLREYFSGVPVENLSKRYGYAIHKITTLANKHVRPLIE